MSYQIIILIVISAIVIYFSMAELVWQFRNKQFRRRLIIGVLIAALLISQIDFINLFTKTDAETVSAAAADSEADTETGEENTRDSFIVKLSDGIKQHAANVGTALDELMQPDTWKVVRILSETDTEPVEGTEVDENAFSEEGSGDAEGEILTEIEEGTEEENLTEVENGIEVENPSEAESSTEEENSVEVEKGTKEENSTELETGTKEENSSKIETGAKEENSSEIENSTEEKNPSEKSTEEENSPESEKKTEEENSAETKKKTEEENTTDTEKGTEQENAKEVEKGTEEENPAETETGTKEDNTTGKENSAEESHKDDSMENSAESGKSLDEAEAAADTKNKKESAKKAGKDSGDGVAAFSAGDTMLMADAGDHDSIIDWIAWGETNSLPSGTGNYYLTTDVTLTSTWKVEGTVNLCQNGKEIKRSVNNYIQVQPGAMLNIYDCKGESSHIASYTITYVPGAYGKGDTKSQTKTKGEAIELLSETFTRTGYTQTGWAESDGGALKYKLGESYDEDKDITLYPVWTADTYTVKYEKDGGTIDKESDYQQYTYGVGLELPIPTKEGYIFEGWYTNSQYNGTVVTSISTTDTGDKTFYAKWAKAYTITYRPGELSIERDDEKQIKTEGVDIHLLPAVFTCTGYVQTGWESDGGLRYDLEALYKEDKDIILYPVWTVAYIITYNGGNYGKGEVEAQIKPHGKDIELSEKTFTRTGYTQTGWAESDGGGLKYKLGGSYTDDKEITLYPVWTVNTYTVKYEKNGGTIDKESDYEKYTYGVGLKLPKPEREGYEFEGWYTNSSFSGKAVTSITTTDTGNKTFYAKWSKISTEEDNNNEDSYDDSNDGNSSSDNGGTGSGNIGNTQPGTEDQTEADIDDPDDIDEDQEDESSLEDTDNPKDKSKGKEKEDDDIDDEDDEDDVDDEDDDDDTDSSDEQEESDDDDDIKFSEGSKKSVEQSGETGIKSASQSSQTMQAGLENGEIVINGNSAGRDGTGSGGNGAGGEASGEESANASIGTGTIPGEEAAVTVLTVGEGSVIVTVVSDEWQYGAGVADTVAVANTVLTLEQKQLISSGENIEIRLVVKDISKQVSEEVKGIIEDGLKADREEESDELIPAAYIDISVDIRTGDGDWEAITQTDKPIKIVVGIPEEWSDGRTFYVARSHESAYALLEDLDSEAGTITIMTELFSTYAIVYQQMPVIAIGADMISDFVTSHSWITIAGIAIALFYIAIMEILGIIVILLLWKQYKKEKEAEKKEVVTT